MAREILAAEPEPRTYEDGRFDEFCEEIQRIGRRRAEEALWYTGALDALARARYADPVRWSPGDQGWRWWLGYLTDDELLGIPGIGRLRLRAIRGIAPRSPWSLYDDPPHRDRLRPPPPKDRHPWWLLP